MRVGIVTFHRAENFGAVLQTYALQTFLKQSGYDVWVIDYRCKAIEVNYHIFNPSILWSRKNIFVSMKQYINRFSTFRERRLRKKQYQCFRNHFLTQTPSLSELSDLGFDAYITGSDQVWNFHLTSGFDKSYFLEFSEKLPVKRIAYAVSSDNDPCNLISVYRDYVCSALGRFNAISVRENFFKEKLTQYIHQNIDVCLDPTFLLEKDDYLKMAIKPEENNYVLIYHMTASFEASMLAERIASSLQCEVVEAFGGYNKSVNDQFITKYHLSPTELLGYIANAKNVVTTSFHGLALSLKLHKNVWVINRGDNLRQKNLLKLIGLEDRLVDDVNGVDLTQNIDYESVDSLLHLAIEHSKTFLLSALK